jgi:hypothetical protein
MKKQTSQSLFLFLFMLSFPLNMVYSQAITYENPPNKYPDGIYMLTNKTNCDGCVVSLNEYFSKLKRRKQFPLFAITLVDTINYEIEKKEALEKHIIYDSLIYFLSSSEKSFHQKIIDYDNNDVFQTEAMQPGPNVIVKVNNTVEVYKTIVVMRDNKITKEFKKIIKKHIKKTF